MKNEALGLEDKALRWVSEELPTGWILCALLLLPHCLLLGLVAQRLPQQKQNFPPWDVASLKVALPCWYQMRVSTGYHPTDWTGIATLAAKFSSYLLK